MVEKCFIMRVPKLRFLKHIPSMKISTTTPRVYSVFSLRHSMRLASIGALLALSTPLVLADNGSWNVDANGLWSTGSNWLDGTIADGAGSIATFSNNITASRTVSLDSARTIGSLVFGDSDSSSSAGWTLNNNGSGSNVLTLLGGTPSITVEGLAAGQSATISAVLAGSSGLVKRGSGTLSLSAANTFTGGITIDQGVLRVTGAGSSANLPLQALTLRGGSFIFDNAGGSSSKALSLASVSSSRGSNRVVVQRASGNTNVTLALSSIGTRSVGAVTTYELRNNDGSLLTNPSNMSITTASGAVANTSEQGTFITHAGGTDYAIWNGNGAGALRAPIYGTTTNFSVAGASLAGTVATNNLVSSSIAGQSSASVRTVKFDGASAVNLGLADNATLTLGIGGLLRSGGGATTISGNGAKLTTVTNGEYVFNTASSTDSLALNVAVTANGSNALTKAGDGTLTLGGNNTYTGNTYVTAGMLVLAENAQMTFLIGSSGVNTSISGTGGLTLNGSFSFDLTGAGTTVGDSWMIVDSASLTDVYGSTFSIVGFTENAGIWTNGNYQFSEASGLLSVVPEPTTSAILLFGVLVILGLHRPRRCAM